MVEAHAFKKDRQYWKFCMYGFLKNLRFFEPFLLLFLLEKGVSYWQIGTLYAAREIGINVLEIPTGFIADAFGRRRTMISAFAFYCLSFSLFYFADTYGGLLAAILIFAVAEALRSGVHKAMIFTYLSLKGWSDQKVHYYGHTRAWSQRGSAVSSLLAAVIVMVGGDYASVFLYSIIPYLLDMLLIWSYPAILDGDRLNRWNAQAIGEKFRELGKAFYQTFRHGPILRAVNNVSLHSGYFQAVRDYLQPILTVIALGLPLWEDRPEAFRSALLIGVVYFVIYFLTATASQNAGRVAGRFAALRIPLNVTLTLGLFTGCCAGLLQHFGLSLPATLLFVGMYVIENLRNPMGVAFIADRIDAGIMASALSTKSQLKSIWAAVIALTLGAGVEWLGVGAGLALSTALTLLLLPLMWIRDR